MRFPQLVIETNENYKETTLFPWIPKSTSNILIKYDAIPIKYDKDDSKGNNENSRQYIVTLNFPFNYNYIHLEHDGNIFKVKLIHSSNELNLALYSCDKFSDISYMLNDLKYKIPKTVFSDFYFSNSDSPQKIKHIDYHFQNFLSPYLPQQAYLLVQSEPSFAGSILYNVSTNNIYGILYETQEQHIVIPSVAIRRLFDGINTDFKYSNFFADYKTINNVITSGIKMVKTYYYDIKKDEVVVDINNLMILNGKINYQKINEWVPIEVYLWYEWLPGMNMKLNCYNKGKYYEKSLPFIDFSERLNIPMTNYKKDSKIMKLSYDILEYLYEKNIILKNDLVDKYLSEPYEKNIITIDFNEEILDRKYLEPTEITEFNIVEN